MPSNFEILGYEDTELGAICLRRRELLSQPGTVITEITLDHELLMSSHHTASERALASEGLARHAGNALRVLIGGLGLGYTAREVLLSGSVARVDVIEYLPQVTQWMEEGLFPLSKELNADPRLHVVQADVYARLAAPPAEQFDLILIDVDHSPDEHLGTANAGFYSEAGLRAAKQHMAADGVFAVWSYAEHSPFVDALRAVFARVEVEPVTFRNELIDEDETDWLFVGRDA